MSPPNRKYIENIISGVIIGVTVSIFLATFKSIYDNWEDYVEHKVQMIFFNEIVETMKSSCQEKSNARFLRNDFSLDEERYFRINSSVRYIRNAIDVRFDRINFEGVQLIKETLELYVQPVLDSVDKSRSRPLLSKSECEYIVLAFEIIQPSLPKFKK